MPQAARLTLWKLTSLCLGIALFCTTVFAVRAYAAAQPNMEAALHHLEEAKGALERAEHDKGGWRVKAIEHVNQAIAATRDGIAVGNR